MRRILLTGACLLALSDRAHAQIPVTDAGVLVDFGESLIQQAKEFALETQQELIETKELIGDEFSWATQAAQYAQQGQMYLTEATQLAAFVRDPNLGAAMGLLNQAGLGSSMPVNPMAVMGIVSGVNNIGTSGISGIAGLAGSLNSLVGSSYTSHTVYVPTDGTWDDQQIIANANSIAGTQGTALAAYGDLATHSAALQSLRDHLNDATTPKDVQDTQAQIALEQTWTENQGAKLTAAQLAYQAQTDSRAQQAHEQLTKSLDDQLQQAEAEGINQ